MKNSFEVRKERDLFIDGGLAGSHNDESKFFDLYTYAEDYLKDLAENYFDREYAGEYNKEKSRIIVNNQLEKSGQLAITLKTTVGKIRITEYTRFSIVMIKETI